MELFNINDIAKFSDENPDYPGFKILPGGYVLYKLISNDKGAVSVACFRDGQKAAQLHSHADAVEIYYVVEGEALATDSEGTEKRLGPGSIAYFDAGERHNMHSAPGSDCIYYRVHAGRYGSEKEWGINRKEAFNGAIFAI